MGQLRFLETVFTCVRMRVCVRVCVRVGVACTCRRVGVLCALLSAVSLHSFAVSRRFVLLAMSPVRIEGWKARKGLFVAWIGVKGERLERGGEGVRKHKKGAPFAGCPLFERFALLDC